LRPGLTCPPSNDDNDEVGDGVDDDDDDDEVGYDGGDSTGVTPTEE
jgi:hypothetical protein